MASSRGPESVISPQFGPFRPTGYGEILRKILEQIGKSLIEKVLDSRLLQYNNAVLSFIDIKATTLTISGLLK